ncbi:hypothetical protein PENSPDRAFT_619755 [Peniophora sp. CONT]|nr:hypothetical protein PENSPDRAFT_619755 [Peniophora sp. CONT]
MIEIDVSELAGIVCEGILFGTFLTLVLTALWILFEKRGRGQRNLPFIGAALVMLGLSFAQIIVDTINIFRAFIPLDRAQRILFLVNVTEPIFAAKHSIFFTQMLVGDAIVIFRAYIVWDRNYWVILVPVLCWIGSGVSAYQTIWAVRHIASASIVGETKWGLAVFALSLSANGIATGLIAWRILKHARAMSRSVVSSGPRLGPVARIVLESGAVNAAYLLAYLIVLQSGSHGLEIMANISTPLVGIIYSVVIIRATRSSRSSNTMSSRSIGSQPPTTTSGAVFSVHRHYGDSQAAEYGQQSDSGHIELSHKHIEDDYGKVMPVV